MAVLKFRQRWATVLVFIFSVLFLSACNQTNVRGDGGDYFRLTKRDAASYEEAGKWWGTRHWNRKNPANDVSDTYHFVLLENGQVKWEKNCGKVDRTPCKEKLKNGEKSITLHP